MALAVANRYDPESYSYAAEQIAIAREVAEATQECAPLLRLRSFMLNLCSQEHDGDLDEICTATIESDIDKVIMNRCGGDHELFDRVIGRAA